ncbi:MAG: 3-phenylpropionate/trans-cinnamate dioxygenase ferredoxin reductase component [Solirubrobacteraceae bacterium]|jgi:3-phenylpropionate/trans-cinnamate dioxygenase ferredoxin reductase subunit|nr:3-phenylpropionate/trans-cinnamate dioxygenase ferredoxin reductase component [Solirubrobacteraceae bacterium]
MPETELGTGVLVVGAGAAGSACAETLRDGGYGGSILVAGRDVDPPYDRPSVTKQYLSGEAAREETYLHPPGWWAEHDVDLRVRTSVTALDTQARAATLSDKTVVAFEHAVLATGANVRRLRVDGGQLEGIHYVRALGNADTIRAGADDAERIVVVGGSYIACEVAATLTARGRSVTMVAEEQLPLSRGFGDTAGAYFRDVLTSRGVEWAGGDALAAFEGDEHVDSVRTASGRSIPAQTVVMGTGVMPDVMLARSAGLQLGDTGGVRCSARLETSAPGIWAAGDICEYDSVLHGRRLRVEHWEVARGQGAAVARAILGSEQPYDDVPYFWSDLADWASLEYVGPAARWDREVVRGSVQRGEFAIFYLDGGRVAGALSVGRGDDLELARRQIADPSLPVEF